MGRRFVLVLALAAGLPVFSGCLFSGNSKTIQPTVGQELTDLKTARDKGAITEDEYNSKRVALLEGNKQKKDGSGSTATVASWKDMGSKNR